MSSFEAATGRARRSQVEFAKASAMATAVQLIATAIVLAVLVEVAVDRLGMPVADLLVLAFIFTRLVPQVTSVQSSLQLAAQTVPAYDELAAIIRDCEGAAEGASEDAAGDAAARVVVPASSRTTPVELHSAVRLDHVSFSYRRPEGDDVEVLHDVSLKLPVRSTTALIGPSGAGKTTVADLVVGLLRPTAGSVTINGVPLAGPHLDRWRESVAMVPQDSFLFHDTIRANVLWAHAEATELDIWRALKNASAARFVEQLGDGLDTVVGDRGARMSGGERQRIALARALLRKPELLVLDEATNALDAQNERVMLEARSTLHDASPCWSSPINGRPSARSTTSSALVDGRLVEATRAAELSGRSGGSA